MSNTDKHEFSSIWKSIRCCNDVMNDVDCVRKREVYPQNVHSYSKNIRWMSVFILKISCVYQRKYIMSDIAWIFALLKDRYNLSNRLQNRSLVEESSLRNILGKKEDAISMGECNTILSAYTKYRHLG